MELGVELVEEGFAKSGGVFQNWVLSGGGGCGGEGVV